MSDSRAPLHICRAYCTSSHGQGHLCTYMPYEHPCSVNCGIQSFHSKSKSFRSTTEIVLKRSVQLTSRRADHEICLRHIQTRNDRNSSQTCLSPQSYCAVMCEHSGLINQPCACNFSYVLRALFKFKLISKIKQ